MTSEPIETRWSKMLNHFSECNKGRATRLGVFEPGAAAVTDYWLESGLPIDGIHVEGGRLPTVVMKLGGMTHEAKDLLSVDIKLSLSGEEDGIDLHHAGGGTTVLRLEKES